MMNLRRRGGGGRIHLGRACTCGRGTSGTLHGPADGKFSIPAAADALRALRVRRSAR